MPRAGAGISEATHAVGIIWRYFTYGNSGEEQFADLGDLVLI